MLKLSESVESVKRNIDRYWKTARENPDLIKDAAKVRQWKAYRDSDGGWRFGPSRFVGYEGMTAERYIDRKKRSSGGLSGTETEKHLDQWEEGVPKGSKLHQQLLDALADFLGAAEIAVNRSARFSTLEAGHDIEAVKASDPGDVEVEALVTLSKRLTPMHLRKLTRRLEAIQGA